MEKYKEYLSTLCNSYAEIFFLRSQLAGVAIFTITFLNINVGLSGFIAVLAAFGFAKLIGMDQTFLKSGFYTYNAVLVGLSLGYLFKISALSLFFIIVAGIFTFIISTILNKIFSDFLAIPILSVPFVLVTSMCYLASYGYSNLYVNGAYNHSETIFVNLPFWVHGYLRSLGAIMFAPNIISGTVFALILLITSPVLFLLSVYGYVVGASIAALLDGSVYTAFASIHNYNYILIAMAIGGVFIVPGYRSFILAGVAVATASIFSDAVSVLWAGFGIPILTLPFNVISLSFLYMLKSILYKYIPAYIGYNPESTLDHFLFNRRRFEDTPYIIRLPFSGKWSVWQGFDGKWTHKNQWRYAYDFVIKQNNSTFVNTGLELTDYHCYRKPVLSPCKGRVVRIENSNADNPPGERDLYNNWGNYIIIEHEHGFFVEISHFAHKSIEVEAGQWVEIGTMLGLCGNSGNSPQPHIHVQVQATAELGAVTLPFCFQAYMSNNKFYYRDIPNEKDDVYPLMTDPILEKRTDFLLNHDYIFQLHDNQEGLTYKYSLGLKISELGEYYFTIDNSKLFFRKDRYCWYCYRLEGDNKLLRILFSSLPKMPLCYDDNLFWRDYLPVRAIYSKYKSYILIFFQVFYHKLINIRYNAYWLNQDTVKAEVIKGFRIIPIEIKMSDNICFAKIRYGQYLVKYINKHNIDRIEDDE